MFLQFIVPCGHSLNVPHVPAMLQYPEPHSSLFEHFEPLFRHVLSPHSLHASFFVVILSIAGYSSSGLTTL